jgi:hypothetical protein
MLHEFRESLHLTLHFAHFLTHVQDDLDAR